MEIEIKHIELIKGLFEKIDTKANVVDLLNEVNTILYEKKALPISLKALSYYANPKFSKKRYTSFTIKKKTGGDRIINAPVNPLNNILKTLNFVLQSMYTPHKDATGFVLNKSIVDNAKKHTNKRYVYNIDLKDFFHSFDRNRVKMAFMYAPFNLKEEKEPIAFMLASLVTHPFIIDGKIKTVLPQGSPTSPTITNILCYKLDIRLKGLAKRFKATYSRYADDITFSSQFNIFKKDEFLNELKRIIEDDQKLEINPKKTRLQKSNYRQEVTGLIVNTKVNIRKKYVKQLRMWLYYWEKYGFHKAEKIFLKDYINPNMVSKGKPNFTNVIQGKLEFLKMVKGTNNSTYLKLQERFEMLTTDTSHLIDILDIWEKEGFEKAMILYKTQIN